MSDTPGWGRLYAARREAEARFGTIWSLPVRKRAHHVLLAHVAGGHRVLEVGAGQRRMKDLIDRRRPDCTYRSLDVDPDGDHDYRDFDQIDEAFDLVFAFEVIEHLPLDGAWHMLEQLARVCRPGGTLLLSTPNTCYPPAFLRDATHRTPFAHDELAGLADLAGFEAIQLVRLYSAPFVHKVLHRLLFYGVHRLLRIDYARQILLVARRRSPV